MVSAWAASWNVTWPGPDSCDQRTATSWPESDLALPERNVLPPWITTRSIPASTLGGKGGELPESYTFHSRMPVESRPSESISRRSLVVRISSNVVGLKVLPATPRPCAEPTGANALPSQYNNRQALGAPTPRPSIHQ